eukprot:2131226-Pleurochrysis_carterae.AAC.1
MDAADAPYLALIAAPSIWPGGTRERASKPRTSRAQTSRSTACTSPTCTRTTPSSPWWAWSAPSGP